MTTQVQGIPWQARSPPACMQPRRNVHPKGKNSDLSPTRTAKGKNKFENFNQVGSGTVIGCNSIPRRGCGAMFVFTTAIIRKFLGQPQNETHWFNQQKSMISKWSNGMLRDLTISLRADLKTLWIHLWHNCQFVCLRRSFPRFKCCSELCCTWQERGWLIVSSDLYLNCNSKTGLCTIWDMHHGTPQRS